MQGVAPGIFDRARDYLLDRGFGARMRIEDITASVLLDDTAAVNTEIPLVLTNTDPRLSYQGSFDNTGKLGANQCAVMLMLGFVGDVDAQLADIVTAARWFEVQRFNLYAQNNLAISRIVGTAFGIAASHISNGGDAGTTFASYFGEEQQDVLTPLEGVIPVLPSESLLMTIYQTTPPTWAGADVYFTANARFLVADQGMD